MNPIFPGQLPDESVEYLIRKHRIVSFKAFLLWILFGLCPLLLFFVFEHFLPPFLEAWSSANSVFVLIPLFYYLLFSVWLYIRFLNEELDFMIVTSRRIVMLEQVDLLHRAWSECELRQIQDVKGTEIGFLASLFQYGRVQIQTASHQSTFVMNYVNNPELVARNILLVRNHFCKIK